MIDNIKLNENGNTINNIILNKMTSTQLTHFDNLINGRRYLFHVKRPFESNMTTFQADFIYIIRKTTPTIAFSKYNDGINMTDTGIRTMPLEWIKKAEPIDEVTYPEMVILSNILIEIENAR